MKETILFSISPDDLQTIIIDSVNACLRHHKSEGNNAELTSGLLSIEQAAKFLNLSKQTVYGMVSSRKIPHSKKNKRLYFSKQELTAWIKEGRKKTVDEIKKEVKNG